eukprot:1113660_1
MYEKRNQQLANQQTHTKRFNDYQIAYLREIHGVRILSYDDGNTITGTPDNHVVWSTKYWEDMVIEHGYLNNEYKETKRIKERRKPILIDQYTLHVNPQTHRFGAPLPRQRTNVLDTSSNTNSSVNRGITLPTLRPPSSNVVGTSSMQSNSISHRNQMNVNLQRHSNENDRTIQPMALDTSNVQRHQSMQSNSHRNINQMNVNQPIRGNPSPNLLCKNPPISAKDERLTQTISGATDPSRNVVTRVKQFKDEARHQMYTKSTAHAKGTKRSNPFFYFY